MKRARGRTSYIFCVYCCCGVVGVVPVPCVPELGDDPFPELGDDPKLDPDEEP